MVKLELRIPVDQTHAIGLIKHIVHTEGITGLYRGMTLNLCRYSKISYTNISCLFNNLYYPLRRLSSQDT